MRIEPKYIYDGLPCSYVATGCAYEEHYGRTFMAPLPDGLRNGGYLSLEGANRFIRKYLPVRKRVSFRRSERPLLKDFLRTNHERACVCLYGHFVYISGGDYWSYFENENDPVVCVWYLKENG